ncbi:PHP domain-containing protein [Treponema sp.]|uniref:PHP domain-containing protein n=1 Tax=Treponema sp. TaxID=166 RepID=UPI003F0F3827
MIDLHTHSTASDGTLDSEQLISYAAEKKISVIALTDHDTIDGIPSAQEKARNLGIEFVPGIEVSIKWPTGEFHLLGLGLKHQGKKLLELIEFLKAERNSRNLKIIQKLQEQQIDITYEELLQKSGALTIGRPHIAKLLAEKGIVKKPQQAFDNFLAKGRPCYVSKEGADLAQAVQAIKESGGIPVQAHPLSMYVSWGKMHETMAQIKNSGVEGLEAYHPGARLSEAQKLRDLAEKLGMISTGGSDFHGEKVRADRKIGYASGGYKINDTFWTEQLRPALEKIHGGSDHSFSIS